MSHVFWGRGIALLGVGWPLFSRKPKEEDLKTVDPVVPMERDAAASDVDPGPDDKEEDAKTLDSVAPTERDAPAPDVASDPDDKEEELLADCQGAWGQKASAPRSAQCYFNHTRCGRTCQHNAKRLNWNMFKEHEPQGLDFYYRHAAFIAHKRHDRAFLCGSGPSMNLVDGRLAPVIKQYFDVWATNQFYFHNYLVPDFYHVEFLNDTNYMWQWNFIGNETQQERYRSTLFLGRGFGDVKTLLKVTAGVRARTFLYDMPIETKRSCDAQSGQFRPKCGELTKFCKASMTMVLSLIVAMEYEEVYILGIDLTTRGHFWTQNEAYRHLKLSDKEMMRSGLGGKHGTVERNFTGFVFNLFDYNRDRVRGFNLSPFSRELLHLPYVPLKAALGKVCEKKKRRKHRRPQVDSSLSKAKRLPSKPPGLLDRAPVNEVTAYAGPSFDDVSRETSASALSCLSKSRTNHWAHVPPAKSAHSELCGNVVGEGFATSNKGNAYLTSVYGESIFDASGFCPLCVAVASLFCTAPRSPVLLMHTPEVPTLELGLLERMFGVRPIKVQNIPPSKKCMQQISDRQQRLGSVLMKLNYWNFTHLKRIVVFDSDVLFLKNLDVLFEQEYSTPIAAVIRGAQKIKLAQNNPATGKVRKGGFGFNGGLVVARPSKRIFNQLIEAIPNLKSCTSGVEQRLFTNVRKTVFDLVTEIPSAFNCREKETSQVKQSCMLDGLPVHMMHWSGPNVKPWMLTGDLERTRVLWAGVGEGSYFLRRWHYLHQRFFGTLCPTS